ncbi:hypothetical protein [Stigmatella aurantiaca]|uniref:Lipoprotein n=1 Tax=Stigmatella aurantiaca (strain DW4/3-1) TaxID=378806 RepID=Q08VT7_STIAD|nr:hypothetical protein [Stigmatella aurantiaca]EAU64620.1 hypothetical protein STIAU_4469 [Stigmatella aurantiaca DW4/3-1]
MRRIAWVVLWGVMLGTMGGCSLRKVSRSAASGAIESLGEPGEEEVFRRKVARVADRFLDNALKDPPDAREIGRDTASGMLEGVEGYLSEEGRGARLGEAGAGFAQELVPVLAAEMRNMAPTSRLILEQSGQGLVDGLSSRREEIAALMAEIADQWAAPWPAPWPSSFATRCSSSRRAAQRGPLPGREASPTGPPRRACAGP